MATIKCKMCGGNIEASDDKTYGTCDSCGSTISMRNDRSSEHQSINSTENTPDWHMSVEFIAECSKKFREGQIKEEQKQHYHNAIAQITSHSTVSQLKSAIQELQSAGDFEDSQVRLIEAEKQLQKLLKKLKMRKAFLKLWIFLLTLVFLFLLLILVVGLSNDGVVPAAIFLATIVIIVFFIRKNLKKKLKKCLEQIRSI